MTLRSGSSLLLVLLGLAACKPGGSTTKAKVNDPTLCSTAQKGLTVASCQLQLGVPLSSVPPTGGRYISTPGQLDYYSFKTSATADARTILHVVGGYNAPQTAVNFTATVLDQNGVTPVVSGKDQHGQAAPQLVELLTRLNQPSTPFLIRVQDSPVPPNTPQIDLIHPYDLTASLVEDPDPNEPNDTPQTATPVPLAAGANGQVGTQQGYLSVPGDVDYFSVNVPAGGRQILYMHLDMTQTDNTVQRPPNYQLAYTLYDPTGKPLSEGHMANQFLAVNLGTARLVATPGTYTIAVQGWQDPFLGVPNGDLAYRYNLTVQLMSDLDTNEPNDTAASPTVLTSLSGVGASVQATGRLSYVGDRDYYQVGVPTPGGAPLYLHYKLTGATSGGRFPYPLPGSQAHEVRLFSEPGSATTCNSTCPLDNDTQNEIINQWNTTRATFCADTPSLCLWSSRTESTEIANLRNLEGTIPITSGISSYLFVVEANQDNWADDNTYTVSFDIQQGTTQNVTVANLGTPQTLTGSLIGGYGRLYQYNPYNQTGPLPGVRGPMDYDAILPADKYELDVPLPAASPNYDQTWQLQWVVNNLSDGSKPYELTIGVQFCTDSTCATPVQLPGNGYLADIQTAQPVWWMGTNYLNLQADWDIPYALSHQTASDTISAKPYQCLCLESSFVQAGKFFITVQAADRNAYGAGPYSITTSVSAYPGSPFTLKDGSSMTCPWAGAADAGTSDAGVKVGCQISAG